MKQIFPKVLILGPTFNKHTGTGITLSNLFKNWPSERLFVATSKRFVDTSDFSICDNYYQMGYKENKMRWPFYYFQPKYYSGLVRINNESDSNDTIYHIGESNTLKKILRYFFNKINFNSISSRLILSEELKIAIDEFAPDILYTHLSNYEIIFLTKALKRKFQIPLVIHIMDDWPSYCKIGFLNRLFFVKYIEHEFRTLIEHSSALFSIGEYMSEEYFLRYGYEFIPFQNCIDYKSIEREDKRLIKNEDFIILYAGRIGIGTSTSLLEIAKSVNCLTAEGLDIVFEIQTVDIENPITKKIKKYQSTKFVPRLLYSELQAKFSSVDLLILPMDFDSKNLKYIKYSMPTKLPEYLATGVPVLVFSPEETALTKLFKKYNLGYVVTEKNKHNTKEIIKEALYNKNQNCIYNNNAIEYLKNNKDCIKVRNSFRDILVKIME